MLKKKSSILLKKPIQVEDNIIVSTYLPNIEAPKYIKQTLTDIKGKTDINTIRVGDFNTPLTSMNWWSRQKMDKETLALNGTLDHKYLIDI